MTLVEKCQRSNVDLTPKLTPKFEEYQWLCDALQLAGLSDDEALAWLEEVRAAGMDTRLTGPTQSTRLVQDMKHYGDLGVPPPP